MYTPILDSIKEPSDIKNLSEEKLYILCDELRQVIVDTVSKNGGHLSSNLGVVELTVAIHKCFDSPDDCIIWDVGHQSYVHKLLTGRKENFNTLRQADGISGFTSPEESVHDIFYSGHSSTSISAAYGVSQSKKLDGNKNHTIAVIGDGALSGGMAYEALNNAGRNRTGLIVILNDNDMSISRNIGALEKHLSVVRSKPSYYRLKSGIENTFNKIPAVGPTISNEVFKLKTYIKSAIYNQSTIFEDMGFRYVGPVDGHDIGFLCDAFESAKMTDYPMFIHVITKKGYGYEPAEKKPDLYHGVSSFDVATGDIKKSSQPDFSSCFGKELVFLAKKDKNICAITAAMTSGTGLSAFASELPDRFFDVGIAEEHGVTFASGLSRGGKLPVVAVYSSFLQRAYDQIIHDVSLQGLKVVFAIDRAGFVPDDGRTHHGLFDVPFLNTVPDITVYSPSCFDELKLYLKKALYDEPGAVAVRYPKGEEPALPADFMVSGEDFDTFGEGKDIAIVTYGRIFSNCYEALKRLEEMGIFVRLVKLNKIKPVSPFAIEELSGFKNVFFFEEGERSGGVGENLCLRLLENGFVGKYYLTAVPDCFVPHAKTEELIKRYGLDTDSIVARVSEEISNDC